MSPDRQSSILEALYRAGEYYHEKGDTENAQIQLRQALELSHDHVPSRLLLSEVFAQAGRPDEALAELEKAYRADKDTARRPLVEALLAKGARSESEGEEEEALRAYEHVIEVASDDPTAPQRISDIWRKRAEHAVETDDLDLALQAYTKAELQDEVERIKELIRKKELQRNADAARAHEESAEWEQACSCYKLLIEHDPGNEEWTQALGKAEVESNLAKCYAEGVEALEHSEWKRASDSFLEVLIVRLDYKNAAQHLVQAVEKTTKRENPATEPEPERPASEEDEGTPPPSTEASRVPGRLDMTWVLVGATLFSFLGALAVVSFLAIPSASSAALPQAAPPSSLSSADGWIIAYEQFLGFLAQERSIPNAPLAVFVLLLTAGLAGWLACRLRMEHDLGSGQVTDGRGTGEELAPVGIVQSSLFGHAVRGLNESGKDDLLRRPETPSITLDAAALKNAPSIGEAQPKNGVTPVADPVLSSLSDAELKDTALELAEEVRSFGRKWKLMAGEAASYPPPKSDDSVQLYVDLIEKLGGFQENFDKTYRKRVSETCESIVQRVPQKEKTGGEVGQATEADDVEDAARRLERLASLL